MSMHPRTLIANIVSGVLTAIIVIGLAYFIYEKQDSFSLFAPSGKIESDFAAAPKPIASERIDEEQVENEMNRIADEKRKVEEKRKAEEARQKAAAEAKRKAEEARKKAEAEKKRLAELEAKKKAEAAEQKRLDEIALKKKQEEEKKKKDEEVRQQKLAEEKKEKQQQEEIKKKEEKAVADKKAATDAANEAERKRLMDQKAAADKQKAEEAKKAAAAAAAAKAKADADAKAKADAAAKADGLRSLEDAGYQAKLAEVFRSQWNIGMDAIGYTAVVAIRVDKTGKILEIIASKSTWSRNDVFDANVKATVWRVGKVPVPNNQNGANQLANQILYISFDPKDMGLSYY
ncbi:MAG: TonB C-terminal domain-containing protein [Wohlfahrtiimonas sp.]